MDKIRKTEKSFYALAKVEDNLISTNKTNALSVNMRKIVKREDRSFKRNNYI